MGFITIFHRDLGEDVWVTFSIRIQLLRKSKIMSIRGLFALFAPMYPIDVSRWNDPLILTIDPNFCYRDIQVAYFFQKAHLRWGYPKCCPKLCDIPY